MNKNLSMIIITSIWLFTVIVIKVYAIDNAGTDIQKIGLHVFDAIISIAWGYYLSLHLSANEKAIKEVTKSFNNTILQYKNRIESMYMNLAIRKKSNNEEQIRTEELHPEFILGMRYVMHSLFQTMRSAIYDTSKLIEELGGNKEKFIKEQTNEFLSLSKEAEESLQRITALDVHEMFSDKKFIGADKIINSEEK